MTRVFLTGGSGLIGGALVARLAERGDEVVAMARSDSAERELVAGGARVVRGDVLDEDAMAAGMAGCAVDLPRGRHQHDVPHRPRRALPRQRARRGGRGACRCARRRAEGGADLVGGVAGRGVGDGGHRGVGTPRQLPLDTTSAPSTRASEPRSRPRSRAGVELVAVNPSSVQGPGRASGTGRILIAYLNGRLPAFLDTQISLVDIADCVEGHLLGAERGVPGERYVLSGATLSSREALDMVAEVSGVRRDVRFLPARMAAAAAALVEAAFRVRGRQPPVCREMVRTLAHGHRYDGSRAQRELGLRYTPVVETFRRTIEWAAREGLVRHPAQAD